MPKTAARDPRSRLDRPCDLCRRHKHLCQIKVRGEPCEACAIRNKACTFDMPPTARKRKATVSEAGPGATDSAGSHGREGGAPTVWTESGERKASLGGGAALAATGSNTSPQHSFANVQPAQRQLGANTVVSFPPLTLPKATMGPLVRSQPLQPGSTMFSYQPQAGPSNYASQPGVLPSATSAPAAASTVSPNDALSVKIDNDDDEASESHYVGASVISEMALRRDAWPSHAPPGVSGHFAFQQVSDDPRTPAYFVKSKALLYGRTPTTGKAVFDAALALTAGKDGPVDGQGGGRQDMLSEAIARLQRHTLPAVPIIDPRKLESACLGLGTSRAPPFALLVGIMAHATDYWTEMRHLHKDLWRQALLGLDDEYRLPRLQTLQLALLQLMSRPDETGENTGQLGIAVARAVGAAHLLGLHMDPTRWKIPEEDKVLRKRVWWALYIQDRWRSLLYGRPTYIRKGYHRVPIPELDAESLRHASPSERFSLETFASLCRMTKIVEDFLEVSHPLDEEADPQVGRLDRMQRVEALLDDLGSAEQWVPQRLRDACNAPSDPSLVTLPTGVRNLQLANYGLRTIMYRLLVDSMSTSSTWAATALADAALKACREVLTFLARLSESDRRAYWAPYSARHMSDPVSLALRIAIFARSNQTALSVASPEPLSGLGDRAASVAEDIVRTLITLQQTHRWSFTAAALRRVMPLLLTAESELPAMRALARDAGKAVGISLDDDLQSSEALLASIGGPEFDPMMWLDDDFGFFSAFLADPAVQALTQSQNGEVDGLQSDVLGTGQGQGLGQEQGMTGLAGPAGTVGQGVPTQQQQGGLVGEGEAMMTDPAFAFWAPEVSNPGAAMDGQA